MKKTMFGMSALFVLALSCSKSSDTTSSSSGNNNNSSCNPNISFSTDVKPIITTSCATNSGCHASGSSNGPGALETYTQIFNARNAISIAVSNGTMPQGSTLSSTNKTLITCWISNGAANN